MLKMWHYGAWSKLFENAGSGFIPYMINTDLQPHLYSFVGTETPNLKFKLRVLHSFLHVQMSDMTTGVPLNLKY
jgi:hypothetical protein